RKRTAEGHGWSGLPQEHYFASFTGNVPASSPLLLLSKAFYSQWVSKFSLPHIRRSPLAGTSNLLFESHRGYDVDVSPKCGYIGLVVFELFMVGGRQHTPQLTRKFALCRSQVVVMRHTGKAKVSHL
ncbi:unnamed protein product, partial [Scytosiphon promiscuus]